MLLGLLLLFLNSGVDDYNHNKYTQENTMKVTAIRPAAPIDRVDISLTTEEAIDLAMSLRHSLETLPYMYGYSGNSTVMILHDELQRALR